MSGKPEYNYDAFFEAQQRLEAAGHVVYNPATNEVNGVEDPLYIAKSREEWASYTPEEHEREWQQVMMRDIRWILEVDALALLPGWRGSRGALLEHHIAAHIGKRISNVDGFLPGGKDYEEIAAAYEDEPDLEVLLGYNSEWFEYLRQDVVVGTQLDAEDVGMAPTFEENQTLKYTGAGVAPQTPAFPGDAGYDLVVARDWFLSPGENGDIPIDINIALPDGYWGLITGRSSTLRKRSLLVNIGIIDNGYRGPLFTNVQNIGRHDVHIEKGERLAQLILFPIHTPPVIAVPELPLSQRGVNAFGSTGK
jgi:dUTP pyrophosphatase